MLSLYQPRGAALSITPPPCLNDPDATVHNVTRAQESRASSCSPFSGWGGGGPRRDGVCCDSGPSVFDTFLPFAGCRLLPSGLFSPSDNLSVKLIKVLETQREICSSALQRSDLSGPENHHWLFVVFIFHRYGFHFCRN